MVVTTTLMKLINLLTENLGKRKNPPIDTLINLWIVCFYVKKEGMIRLLIEEEEENLQSRKRMSSAIPVIRIISVGQTQNRWTSHVRFNIENTRIQQVRCDSSLEFQVRSGMLGNWSKQSRWNLILRVRLLHPSDFGSREEWVSEVVVNLRGWLSLIPHMVV